VIGRPVVAPARLQRAWPALANRRVATPSSGRDGVGAAVRFGSVAIAPMPRCRPIPSATNAALGGASHRAGTIGRMSIELSREARNEAIASIERYFEENMEERIGNIAAGALLGFFLEEIGPAIYNKAVADVQEKLQARIAELDLEAHEDEFQYWPRQARSKTGKGRR